MLIHHVTMMNGHVVAHRLDVLASEAVEVCRALLPAGGPVPGFPAFRVEVVQSKVFTIWRGREPVVTCGIGSGSDGTWDDLVALQSSIVPPEMVLPPIQPPRGRWLAVVILPGIFTLTRDDVGWLADFERCMAGALIGPEP